MQSTLRQVRILSSLVVMLMFSVQPLRATLVDITWTGETDNIATTATNWSSAPAGGENAIFGVPANERYDVLIPNLTDPHITLGNVTFNGEGRGTYTFSGAPSTLGITGNVTVSTPGDIHFDSTLAIHLNYLGSTVDVLTGVNLKVSGTITGDDNGGAITKQGGGVLALGGANTMGGNVSVHAGVLQVHSSSTEVDGVIVNGPVGTGTLKLYDTSTLQVPGTGANFVLHNAIDLDPTTNTNVSIDTASTSTLELLGHISGAASISKTGTGTLTLSHSDSGFAGGLRLNSGTLLLGASGGSEGSAVWGPVGAGTLKLMNDTVLGLATSASTITLDNAVALDGTPGTAGVLVGSSRELTLNGQISGKAGLLKTGSGILSLGSANTFSGGVTIDAGTVEFENNHTAAGTGQLYFNSTGYARFSTTAPVIHGLGSAAGANDAEVQLTHNSDPRLTINQNTDSTYHGDLRSDSGLAGNHDGVFIKAGTGALTLSGSSILSHNGQGATHDILEVQDGTLILSNVWFESATTAVRVNGGTLGIAGGSTLANPVIAGASGGTIGGNGSINGTITMNTGLTFSPGSGDLTVGGVISGSAMLTKAAAGRLVLSGANTYSGGTSIQNGTILANHNAALGTGAVDLNGGSLQLGNGVTLANPLSFTSGTTVLSGTGTFANHITANEHVVLAPGNSPGTLNFAAGLTLAAGSAISFQIQDTLGTVGAAWDLLSVTGGNLSLTATTNTITFNVLFLNSSGTTGLPVNFDPNASYSWAFATAATDITTFSADKFHLVTEGPTAAYAGNFSFGLSSDSRSLVLNFAAVPEPSTYALMALGLCFVGLTAWHRRRG